MSEILYDMIALEEAALRSFPRLGEDPVIMKCEFEASSIVLVDVEYYPATGRKVVVLESCGPLSQYIAEMLRELLAEENIDAWVSFNYESHTKQKMVLL
jgi:hypothetical protein